MKLHSNITINGKQYKKGDKISPIPAYLFFMVHMLAFGASGFYMAYSQSGPKLSFVYIHGGFAILVYTFFYLAMFGVDEVKWMFINAALGILAIYSQIDWLLSYFGKRVSDYPFEVHVIPFLYFILYTFLLRQFVVDITGSRSDENRQRKVEFGYIFISIAIYLGSYMFHDVDLPERTSSSNNSIGSSNSRSSTQTYKRTIPKDKVTAALSRGDHYWDKRNYAEAYKYYKQAYEEANALDDSDISRNRKLAFSSSGIMATACMQGKWEEADAAMKELKERYEDLTPENKKKMDYWIRTGEPRLKKRKC